MSVQRKVREFHEHFAYPVSNVPRVPQDGLRDLRVRLIDQEHGELRESILGDDLVGVAQELADVVYVAYGMALTYGIDLDLVVAEVHRANMTKDRGSTGKAEKGTGFRAANVASLLFVEPCRGAE